MKNTILPERKGVTKAIKAGMKDCLAVDNVNIDFKG
jgi:hypothetical protein